MNIISNTLISLDFDPSITLSASTTTILDEEKFTIQIGDIEYDVSIETINELICALMKLKGVSNVC